jgi:hypothetical protein
VCVRTRVWRTKTKGPGGDVDSLDLEDWAGIPAKDTAAGARHGVLQRRRKKNQQEHKNMGGRHGQRGVYLMARETNGCARAAGWERQQPGSAAWAGARQQNSTCARAWLARVITDGVGKSGLGARASEHGRGGRHC